MKTQERDGKQDEAVKPITINPYKSPNPLKDLQIISRCLDSGIALWGLDISVPF